jgi:hypothetical protein
MNDMHARYHRGLVSTALVAAALTAEALPSMLELRIDGKVKIKGGELNGARAIIVADDAGTVGLDNGLAHFTYALRLQTRYLLSFEQEGYVTKQVLFDTRVPVEYLAMAPFEFPFQVTLEPPPTGSSAEYVGPVGYVRFMPERKDFGYDTDYTMKIEQRMFERVREFRIAAMDVRQPVSTVSTPTHLPAQVEALPAPPIASDLVEAAPMAASVLPPAPVQVSEVPRPASEPLRAALPSILPAPSPTPAPSVVPVTKVPPAPSTRSMAKPKPAPARRPEITPDVAVTATTQVTTPIQDTPEDRLIVEPTRVTTVLHIQHGGEMVEYRRVAHRFGPVFYFRNGQNCTARVYELETERPAVATATARENVQQ